MLWVRILCKPVFFPIFFSFSSNYCTYNNKVQLLPKYMYIIIITIKVHVHAYITTCRRQIHKVPAKEVV